MLVLTDPAGGPITLIGDASHPVTPAAGQGRAVQADSIKSRDESASGVSA
jgi:hypothetical protein